MKCKMPTEGGALTIPHWHSRKFGTKRCDLFLYSDRYGSLLVGYAGF